MNNNQHLSFYLSSLDWRADDASIESFVKNHQLSADQKLHEAEFWSAGQRDFLKSHWHKDDEWAIVIDELNQQLHVDSTK